MKTYATKFGGAENPLSEKGSWLNSGIDWTNVRKDGGIAHGTQTGTEMGKHKYRDSYAVLSGFPPDQEAWAEAYIARPSSAYYQELEILLRWTSSPNYTTGYECFARCINENSSYLQIVRWDGPLGEYTYLADMRGADYGLENGDIIKASVIGNVITLYVNDVMKAQVVDDTYATGNPGIGIFLHCDGGQGIGTNTDFGFKNFSAQGIEESRGGSSSL